MTLNVTKADRFTVVVGDRESIGPRVQAQFREGWELAGEMLVTPGTNGRGPEYHVPMLRRVAQPAPQEQPKPQTFTKPWPTVPTPTMAGSAVAGGKPIERVLTDKGIRQALRGGSGKVRVTVLTGPNAHRKGTITSQVKSPEGWPVAFDDADDQLPSAAFLKARDLKLIAY